MIGVGRDADAVTLHRDLPADEASAIGGARVVAGTRVGATVDVANIVVATVVGVTVVGGRIVHGEGAA